MSPESYTASDTGIWHSSTRTIYVGVVTIIIFGIASSVLQALNLLMQVTDSLTSVLNNPLPELAAMAERSSLISYFAQGFTLAGWVIYMAGLTKFRRAQASNRAVRLTGSLYTACFLGLLSAAAYLSASMIQHFSVIFSLTGWTIGLISLFKFRSAFSRLSYEDSWDETAQSGASTLRSSCTAGIILWLYPLILLLLAVISIGSGISALSEAVATPDSASQLAAFSLTAILITAIITLGALVLWIVQTVQLMTGWASVGAGSIENYSENEPQKQHNTVTILLTLLAAIAFSAGSLFYIGRGITGTSRTSATERYNGSPGSEILSGSGSIGPHEIELTLETNGDGFYTGEYHYAGGGEIFSLVGKSRSGGAGRTHLDLTEYADVDEIGTFSGILTSRSYTGTWTSADGHERHAFSIKFRR